MECTRKKLKRERESEFHTSDNGHGSVVFQLETVYPVACIENWQIGSDQVRSVTTGK